MEVPKVSDKHWQAISSHRKYMPFPNWHPILSALLFQVTILLSLIGKYVCHVRRMRLSTSKPTCDLNGFDGLGNIEHDVIL